MYLTVYSKENLFAYIVFIMFILTSTEIEILYPPFIVIIHLLIHGLFFDDHPRISLLNNILI